MRPGNVIAFVALMMAPGMARGYDLTPTGAEQTALDNLGSRLPTARLLWVNEGKIWHSTLQPWSPEQVTEASYTEGNPRWSPDGSKILFVREPAGVWVMNADFSNPQLKIQLANTASWTRDGNFITAVNAADDQQIIKYDMVNDTREVLYDSTDGDYAGGYGAGDPLSQAADLHGSGRFLLTFTADRSPGGSHHTYIVDLQDKTYIYNNQMDRGDCSPAWSPDGSYLINTARTSNRPVVKADFHASVPDVDPSTVLIGLDPAVCGGCTTFYVHGQRVANGGEWLTFGGLPRSGDFSQNREIYVWKIGEPEDSAVRVSFESNEDKSPDLYVFPDACQDGSDRGCYNGPAGTEGVGACAGGTQHCSGGSWGSCDGEVLPLSEDCGDGVDNDCDGDTDADDLQDCGSQPDAGVGQDAATTSDAARPDGAEDDAAVADAAEPDTAGGVDAAVGDDASAPDRAAADGASPDDAAAGDAGAADSAGVDAASREDAPSGADSLGGGGGRTGLGDGCACGSASSSALGGLLLGLPLLAVGLRRRKGLHAR